MFPLGYGGFIALSGFELKNIYNDRLLRFLLFCLQTCLAERLRECLAHICVGARCVFKRTV